MEILYDNEEELIYDGKEPLSDSYYYGANNKVKYRPNILGRIINHMDIVSMKLLDSNEVKKADIFPIYKEDRNGNNDYMKVEFGDGVLKVDIRQENDKKSEE